MTKMSVMVRMTLIKIGSAASNLLSTSYDGTTAP